VRQLAQLGVLVFVFSSVVHLHIPDYPAFIFVGLLVWGWFAAGVATASVAVMERRHLVFQPRFPDAVLPLVAIAVALSEMLIALPVLLVIVAVAGDLRPEVVLALPLFAVQGLLMAGIGWLTCAATVYLPDVRNLVAVGLLLLFYVTPVFYDLARVPSSAHWVLSLNPLSTLIEAQRAIFLGRPAPTVLALTLVTAASAALAVVGLAVFRRLESGFVDEL
jgi:lipopolysaccharide transport system permease protein